MDQRLQFLAEYQTKERTIVDLRQQFGISRPTAYKWIKRYSEIGPEGLLEESRRPLSCPHAISSEAQSEVIAIRQKCPTWGPRKIKARLKQLYPEVPWPAASTIGQILRRAGLSKPQRIGRRIKVGNEPFAEIEPQIKFGALTLRAGSTRETESVATHSPSRMLSVDT